MNALSVYREQTHAIELPAPRSGPIHIRPAVMPPEGGADYLFIDTLQKRHSEMVGFMHKATIEDNIRNGHVLIAEDVQTATRIGYIIFHDKYLKREELGIVYQLNVTPHKQRGLVGASLVKAAFDRSAYGCRLYCCWCAQDLEANYFWESIGFVPIAFRAGSRGKEQGGKRKEQRIHIFWQRRIREGDDSTPYWFPSETSGGALKENRIVLPIPPGTHWSDAKPVVLPGMERAQRLLEGQTSEVGDQRSEVGDQRSEAKPKRERKSSKESKAAVKAGPRRGLWFAPPAGTDVQAGESSVLSPEEKKAARAKERAAQPKPARKKNDPKLVAAARELRDRYTEQINAAPHVMLPPGANGKYDVSRQLPPASAIAAMRIEQLPGPSGKSDQGDVPLLEAA